MDLETVADELYGLPPADFTGTRDERARQARKAGHAELARSIHRLRRPTLAAWASNLLVREQPEQVRLLRELGEALRQAQRDLDGAQLRALSTRQHQVTSRLAREAADLAAASGHRISDDALRAVAETLHAALADAQAGQEWAAGRLDRPLAAPVGFTGDTGAPAAPAAPSRRRGSGKKSGAVRGSEQQSAGSSSGSRRGRHRSEQHRQELARAREQAREAERELGAREKEERSAQQEADRATQRQERAERRVNELDDKLRDAEQEQHGRKAAARDAHNAVRRAERAVQRARHRSQETAARVDRLAAQAPEADTGPEAG